MNSAATAPLRVIPFAFQDRVQRVLIQGGLSSAFEILQILESTLGIDSEQTLEFTSEGRPISLTSVCQDPTKVSEVHITASEASPSAPTGVQPLASPDDSIHPLPSPAAAASQADLGAQLPWTVEDIRSLTALSSVSTRAIEEKLSKFSDDGYITQASFLRACTQVMCSFWQPGTWDMAAEILNTLYTVLQARGSGLVVSLKPLTSLANAVHITATQATVDAIALLATLSGSSEEEKISAAFRAYDKDGNGFISQQDMESYLTSVFHVYFSTRSDEKLRVSPEEAAQAVTEACFDEADIAHNGSLSYQEFRKWYMSVHSNAVARQVVVSSGATPPLEMSIKEARELTGLEQRTPTEVYDHFAQLTDAEGNLSRETFLQGIQHYLPKTLTPEQVEKARSVLLSIFDAFDGDHDGIVDIIELSTGLGVLCGESRSDRVAAVFQLYDADGDGYLSFEEMESFLEAAFVAKTMIDPGSFPEGVTPKALANSTAHQCIREADRMGNGKLSLEEFREWYESNSMRSVQRTVFETRDAPPLSVLLEDLRRLLHLERFHLAEVHEAFAAKANAFDALDRDSFLDACKTLLPTLSNVEYERALLLLSDLYTSIDDSDDGTVPVSRLLTGISTLCGDSAAKRLRYTFDLYDHNKDGYITQAEMEEYLRTVYMSLQAISPEFAGKQTTPAELAKVTAEDAFRRADTNRDGRLSFEEFRQWLSTAGSGDVAADVVGSIKSKKAMASSLQKLQESTLLSKVSYSEILRDLLSVAPTRKVTWELLERVLSQAIGPELHRDAEALRNVKRLFEAIDEDEDGVVTVADLAASLSFLCSGSAEDKVDIAFKVYDLDGDGRISMDEMESYLEKVFKVMYQADPTLCPPGLTAKDIANATTRECFREADKNQDGVLSPEEFRQWYLTTTSYPLATQDVEEEEEEEEEAEDGVGPLQSESKVRQLVVEKGAKPPAEVFLAELSSLTGLHNVPISQVYETAERFADGMGDLDKVAFRKAMKRYMPYLEASRLERAVILVDQFFQLIDRNNDGVVDAIELATGLSLLCNGTRESQVQKAFELYDADGDGYLEPIELVSCLEALFKVLNTKEDPLKKAEVVSRQCFQEADKNGDGAISFEEFAEWVRQHEDDALVELLVSKNSFLPTALSLAEAKQLAGLDNRDFKEVLKVFKNHADEKGDLSPRRFRTAFLEFLPAPETPEQESRTMLLLETVFKAFDENQDGVVDLRELLIGLSVLCRAGNTIEQLATVFSLYDSNSDGYISPEEMEQYLYHVFKIVLALDVQQALQAEHTDAAAIAKSTTATCFQEADADGDGRLSFDEFIRWYLEEPSSPSRTRVVDQQVDAPFTVSLEALNALTTLEEAPLSQVNAVLRSHADEHGMLNSYGFHKAMETFIKPNLTEGQHARATALLNHLFFAFGGADDGFVDYQEVVLGLSLPTASSPEETAQAAFAMFGDEDSQTLNLEALSQFFAHVLGVAAACGEDMRAIDSFQSYGAAAAKTCLEEVRSHSESKQADEDTITYDDFVGWCSRHTGDRVYTFLNKTLQVSTPLTAATPPNPALKELMKGEQRDETRTVLPHTTLPQASMREVTTALKAAADDDQQTLTLHKFLLATRQFLEAGAPEHVAQAYNNVMSRLFQCYASTTSQTASVPALATGLRVLCGHGVMDNADEAFKLFDTNGDGIIDKQEMESFLSAVFASRLEFDPILAERVGTTPERLAQATASKLFNEVDIDTDGRISFGEFEAWFTAGGGLAVTDAIMVSQDEAPEWMSFAEIQRLTKLSDYSVETLYDLMMKEADPSTNKLTEEGFKRVFETLFSSAEDAEDRQRQKAIRRRLFQLFDTDGDGTISSSELSVGLSQLCGGTRLEKARAAFAKYDTDSNGTISFEEMKNFLAATFKVMLAVEPRTRDLIAADAEELALEAAEACFIEADKDGNGELTFEEFRDWYMETQASSSEANGSNPSKSVNTLEDARQVTGLSTSSCDRLQSLLAAEAKHGDNGYAGISRSAFLSALEPLIPADAPRAAAFDVLRSAFDSFDAEEVPLNDAVAGLSLLCSGSSEDKVKLAFQLFGSSEGAEMSKKAMGRYLNAIFRVLYAVDPSFEGATVSAEELASLTLDECFEDQKATTISYEHFKEWFDSAELTEAAPMP